MKPCTLVTPNGLFTASKAWLGEVKREKANYKVKELKCVELKMSHSQISQDGYECENNAKVEYWLQLHADFSLLLLMIIMA